MTAYDYYGEAKALAEELKLAGFINYETEILRAMEEGETGTEILMILRFRLESMLAAKDVPKSLIERATDLQGRLNDALK